MYTLSYANGISDAPLLGETIGENLRRTVERVPDHEAAVIAHQKWRCTYAELWAQSGRLGRALMARGIAKGDRVGMWAPNRFEWVIAQYATARIGAIMVNVNPAYRAHELQYALNQSGVKLLLMASSFRATSYVDIFQSIEANCPHLESNVVLETDFEAFLAEAPSVSEEQLAERESSLAFDDPINIQYTSGTTGLPKGATLSHHNILNNGYFIARKMNYTEADRVCVPVPFYHCFGMVIGNLACTSTGACIVVPNESFDPELTMDTIQTEKCTSVYGVPTMFIAQLNHPRFAEFDFTSLRTGVMAGSPCPVEVMKQVQSRMHVPEVTICYGMTETSPVSTQSDIDDPLDKRVATVGRIHPHVEIKIIDPETGLTVPRGEKGELCTRGYCVMLGYWNDPETTARAIDGGRWMHTGDLATMDNDGYVNIVGRIKDLIIRGGENISPKEVEEFLYTHDEVEEVQVIGVPSKKYGEEVMAWIKPKEGSVLSGEALSTFCNGEIASFKIPKYWKFTDEFPMTVTGKIQKYRMREISMAELGLAPELTA